MNDRSTMLYALRDLRLYRAELVELIRAVDLAPDAGTVARWGAIVDAWGTFEVPLDAAAVNAVVSRFELGSDDVDVLILRYWMCRVACETLLQLLGSDDADVDDTPWEDPITHFLLAWRLHTRTRVKPEQEPGPRQISAKAKPLREAQERRRLLFEALLRVLLQYFRVRVSAKTAAKAVGVAELSR